MQLAVNTLSLLLLGCLFHRFLACFARVDSAVYLFVGYLDYAFQSIINLFSGDIACAPSACFQDSRLQNSLCSDPAVEIPVESVVHSRKDSIGNRASCPSGGMMAEVAPVKIAPVKILPAETVPVETVPSKTVSSKILPAGIITGFADLRVPPAYSLIMEPRASNLYVNTIGSQLNATTVSGDQNHPVSDSAPNFYCQVGSDPSGRPPRSNYDPVSSVSRVVDTPYLGTGPSLMAITTSTSVPGRPLSTSSTSRTLGDLPTLRRQPLLGKDSSSLIVVGPKPGLNEHHHWLRPCAVCARKKAKVTKTRTSNRITKVRKVSV